MYPTNPPYPGSHQVPPTGYPQGSPYPTLNTPYPPSPYPPGQQPPGPNLGFGSPYPTTPGYPSGPSPLPVGSPYPVPGYPSPAPGYPTSSPGYPSPAPGYPSPAPGYPSVSPTPGYPPASVSPSGGLYPGAAPIQPSYSNVSYSSGPIQGGSPSHHTHTQAYPTQVSHSPVMATVQATPEIPTIREAYFDPAADAQVLRKAMKGFGTDEKALINVLCKRTNNQRMQILNTYKASFGKDLVKDLKSETSGKFEELLVALMTPRYDYMASRVQSAVSGIGTKEHVLIDILCTSSNQELQWIQHAFQRLYGKRLEDEVSSDTSGHFQRLLVSMCAASRNEDPRTDPAMAAQDAQALYSAGLKQWGTDESVFNMIMATRSYPHLRQVFYEYEKITGQDIERTVQNEFSGDIETALLAIVQCVKNRPAYFAKRLNDAMRGMGTNDTALIFYLVTRCEVDLESIKQEYHRMYHKSLAQDISSETSGDYKNGLIALLN